MGIYKGIGDPPLRGRAEGKGNLLGGESVGEIVSMVMNVQGDKESPF